MRVAVISCLKYSDAWRPAFELIRRFWPDCPYEKWLVTDKIGDRSGEADDKAWIYYGGENVSWCQCLAKFAEHAETPALILQEDFWLNAPVNQEMVDRALKLMEHRASIGAVRLYPCPGSDEPSIDPYFAPVRPHTRYRTSCQATIWRPQYLKAIAERYDTPAEFELQGSEWASTHLPAEVWAWKTDVKPAPLSYFCSAIGRGLWSRDALDFCAANGIEVDTSMRGIA